MSFTNLHIHLLRYVYIEIGFKFITKYFDVNIITMEYTIVI